ncbi:hypothetical protein POM88_029864 [Heracleum sosnowskyi]|uniref:RING-type E3 ubiquitin transferase n=1 Tax=Heracleum sosnowskyi TaxID=360622 RepID=A0AAD8HUY5_9APIA|nr:hypothetical protein POM88_029864 [Heracleum sosnowskyi]
MLITLHHLFFVLSNKIENMDFPWTYQESIDDLKQIDELKQQLLFTSIELESVKAEAEKQMKIHKAHEKQSLLFLKMVIQERDEARGQLRKLLNKLVALNYTTPNTELLTTALPQLSPESSLVHPMIPILSTTGSNSFSEPYNYHSQNSSPASSVFEPVPSTELSSTYVGFSSNNIGFANQPFVQDYKGTSPATVVPPSGAPKIDQYIDNLLRGKTLPQKGKLLQSVLDAGPLLETLLLAGPIPKWRNPPTLDTFHVPPPIAGKGGHVKKFNQMPTELSIHALRPENTQRWFGVGKGMSGANDNNSLPTGKKQRFQVSYRLSRHRVQRSRINEENQDDPSLQFQSRGLDSYIARSLPIVQFKKMNDAEIQKTTECAVCLGEFEEGDWIKHLPNCCHVFHVSCIDIWFQTHSSCPLCRAHIFDLEQSCDLLGHLSREDFTEDRPSVREMLHMHVLESPSLRLQIDHETYSRNISKPHNTRSPKMNQANCTMLPEGVCIVNAKQVGMYYYINTCTENLETGQWDLTALPVISLVHI